MVSLDGQMPTGAAPSLSESLHMLATTERGASRKKRKRAGVDRDGAGIGFYSPAGACEALCGRTAALMHAAGEAPLCQRAQQARRYAAERSGHKLVLISRGSKQAKAMEPYLPWLFLQFLLLLGISSAAQAQVNIPLGSSLKPEGPNSHWLSSYGDFAFGFRQLEGNTSSYLLAVWIDTIPEKTVVWYAKSISNGEGSPVQVPSSSVLKLTTDGLLSLRNPAGDEVWSPRIPHVAYARMLDTGNFMLVDADGTAKWETFDFPADTLLPTQVLAVGQEDKVLRSRLIATDYENGRFLLAVQPDGNLVFYPVAEPSTNRYLPYWASNTVGNGLQLVFNETGRIYFTLKNGTQINITWAGGSTMDDFFNRATLDPDGVFRQYVYPKSRKVRNLWISQWTVVSSIPQDICLAIEANAGSGTCGFNSYCSFDGIKNQRSCLCPQRYKFFDDERKYKGCRPDFVPQSCDLNEAAALAQFEMTLVNSVDWPLSDYEEYSDIDETVCRRLCVIDCFCATAVFQASTNTCWKKRLPLSNGYMAESIDRVVLIKVPRGNNTQSQLSSASSKWKEDKKYWILGSSVLLNVLLISILLVGTYCGISITSKKKLQSSQSSGSSILPLKIFTYNELDKATSGFRDVLGSGASGTVYKGQLQDEHATSIAVKKIEKLQQETEEFMVEVQTIGRTFHRNLVRRNVELEIADEERSILTYWANDCYRCGRIGLLVEGDDEANFNIKKAERFVAVSLWCLQEEPTMRPTMLKVIQMLDGAVEIPTPPDPSSFISSLQ
ncbi:hypothetical protein ZWY2020_019530 [Hordeum vulgare]|nr:hypothetical protein ZWY2020_019530 [Hordeum vulgare]